jgi:ribosomal protein S18 acetylase RimI-like enzyme
MTALTIRAMTIHDYDAVCALWTTTEGLCLSEDDSHDRIALFLARNPNLSFVAVMNGELVGSVLCGHDSRRGMLRHLAVKDTCRGQAMVPTP